jgi:hypothetical protein
MALVPMHVDNLALALASGYIGGSLKEDAARDVQSGMDDALLSFTGQVPGWAISEGEGGHRAILSVAVPDGFPDGERDAYVLPGPIRITSVAGACFRDEASLANFMASFEDFPDVATGLVKMSVSWPVARDDLASRPEGLTPPAHASQRVELDFNCGLAAGLLELIEAGGLDEGLFQFLADPGEGLPGMARHLLLALEPGSTALDQAIWIATMETLRSRFGKRGFDRQDFLADVVGRLGEAGQEAASWAAGCRKVFNAEVDVPGLGDGEKAGRRAALAIMLSPEPSGLPGLEENLGAGPRVRALVTLAVRAFEGLSRTPSALKSPGERMDAILAAGERLLAGKPTRVHARTTGITGDLTRTQVIEVEGKAALERTLEPPPYMLMLKARIQEAGYKVELDQESTAMVIRAGGGKGALIAVEERQGTPPGNPVVNLVVPLGRLGARPQVASLKRFLSAAWEHATTVAVRGEVGDEEVVGVASLPLATLDRDELNFHVERLLAVRQGLMGTRKALPGAAGKET